MTVHADLRIQLGQLRRGGFDLAHADAGGAVDHLPLQIGKAHQVVVGQPHCAHAGGRQVQGSGRSQGSDADDQDAGLEQALLAAV